jgi:hypothetical protein
MTCCCCCGGGGCSGGGVCCTVAAVPTLAPSCGSGDVDVGGARIIADARPLVEAWKSCCVRSAGAARLLLGVLVRLSSACCVAASQLRCGRPCVRRSSQHAADRARYSATTVPRTRRSARRSSSQHAAGMGGYGPAGRSALQANRKITLLVNRPCIKL